MAHLTTPDDGIVPLRSPHLIGRDPASALCVPHGSVSAQHASLAWNGDLWIVRDLGSRNGTFVDDQPVPRGESRPVPVGGRVRFASGPEFVLQSGGAPSPFAVHDDGRIVQGDADMLTLGDAVVYATRAGQWQLEHGDRVEVVTDGQRIGDAVLHLPIELAPTIEAVPRPSLEELTLHFRVRRDEERVEISIELPGGERHDLGGRSHHYTLLTLARLRRDEPPGWLRTEDLARKLRIEPNLLYTHVHRSRRQVSDLDVLGAAEIIERRGEMIRMGTDRFTEVRF